MGEHPSPEDEAFLADFRSLSRIGETSGNGVDRQAATLQDAQARTWLTTLLGRGGFRVVIDRIGNIFGLLEWTPGLPYVIVGSHLDSQPLAGKYDGAYGVAAALHAALRINAQLGREELPKHNLAVVNWFNEEGCRFEPSMMGSSVYTGKLALDDAYAATDKEGVSVRDALAAIGYLGNAGGPEAAAYAEIHIEQGRILENTGVKIGLVHSNWAAVKYAITVHGEQSHTGSTPIDERRDALLGAARLVVLLREIAEAFPGTLHTSVGQLTVHPNSPVVVARRVDLLADIRTADEAALREAKKLLAEGLTRVEVETNTVIELEVAHEWAVTPYHPAGVDLAQASADSLKLSHRRVFTLAGHDSTNMKDIVPTVMLFVPSVGGISHNEREFTQDVDALEGVNMLTDVVHRLLSGDLDGASNG